jgi:hypothetical protein
MGTAGVGGTESVATSTDSRRGTQARAASAGVRVGRVGVYSGAKCRLSSGIGGAGGVVARSCRAHSGNVAQVVGGVVGGGGGGAVIAAEAGVGV